MLRVALALAIVAGAHSLQGADHRSAPPLYQGDDTAVVISASGALSARGAAAADSGMMRRDAARQKQPVSHSPQHSAPTAAHKQELLQVDTKQPDTPSTDESDDSSTTQQSTPAPMISCGGHEASFCRRCTVIDPVSGDEIKDRGSAWCNGDCTYYQEECHKLTAQNLHMERDTRLENVATTTGIPDLWNPEITPRDQEIMDKAADSSVEEANFEAKQRLSNEAKREQEKKSKLLLTIIISASSVLFICAVVNLIVLYKYINTGGPKTIDGKEGTSFSEDAGYEDGAGSVGSGDAAVGEEEADAEI